MFWWNVFTNRMNGKFYNPHQQLVLVLQNSLKHLFCSLGDAWQQKAHTPWAMMETRLSALMKVSLTVSFLFRNFGMIICFSLVSFIPENKFGQGIDVHESSSTWYVRSAYCPWLYYCISAITDEPHLIIYCLKKVRQIFLES